LLVYAPVIFAMIGVVLAGAVTTSELVRATSACFIAVYVLALLSAVRILDGPVRIAAAISLVLSAAVAVFSAAYLAVPVVAGVLAFALRRRLHPRPLAVSP
jgi:amino acid efflux transporter